MILKFDMQSSLIYLGKPDEVRVEVRGFFCFLTSSLGLIEDEDDNDDDAEELPVLQT